MSEYRAAVGTFAWTAANAGVRWRSKSKQKKSSKLRVVGGEGKCEKGTSSNPVQFKKRWMSVGGCKTRSKSRTVGQRSRTLNLREDRVKESHQQPAFRTRSQSPVKRRKKVPDAKIDSFKNSCILCKTYLFDQKWQRGRRHKRTRETYKGDRHCSHIGEGPTNLLGDVIRATQLRSTNKMGDIGATHLHFLTSVAAFECLLLELAIFTIVQMLLVKAGIETNPGPTSPTSSVCCNAYQHFRRVENTIEKAQNNFQSKVTQDTLTKKVIEIEETGEYFPLAINTE